MPIITIEVTQELINEATAPLQRAIERELNPDSTVTISWVYVGKDTSTYLQFTHPTKTSQLVRLIDPKIREWLIAHDDEKVVHPLSFELSIPLEFYQEPMRGALKPKGVK